RSPRVAHTARMSSLSVASVSRAPFLRPFVCRNLAVGLVAMWTTACGASKSGPESDQVTSPTASETSNTSVSSQQPNPPPSVTSDVPSAAPPPSAVPAAPTTPTATPSTTGLPSTPPAATGSPDGSSSDPGLSASSSDDPDPSDETETPAGPSDSRTAAQL